ncbi:MAG: SMC family ATPase [Candidatus Micrarchaeota archaeon]|nr:SMC family ATPase [Candidatus Micrarchaeota archaeon]MCX8154645.1 SMC family ATPase [Candidatus Micrarchaeota archaeon]
MITKITLKNWMSHKDTQIQFRKGKILIHGKNGSGKTSIIEGIVYGLFGEIREGYRKINRTTKKEYIRDGSDTATVEVEFAINNRKCKITRILSRNKPERVIMYVDDKKISENDNEVRNIVLKLLNVDESIFANVFYGAQDGIYQIMDLQPKQIKEYLDRILGIEEFQGRIDMLKRIINEGEKRIKELSNNIDSYKKDLEEYQRELERLKSHENDREIHQKQYNELAVRYDQMKKEESNITDRYQKYLNAKQTLNRIDGQIKSIDEEIKRITEDIERLGGFQRIEQRILEIDREIELISSTIENITKLKEERIRLETEVENIESSIKELKSQRENIYRQIDQDTQNIQTLQTQRSELKIVPPLQDRNIQIYGISIMIVLLLSSINPYLIAIALPIAVLGYIRYSELERMNSNTQNRIREIDITIETLKSKISDSESSIRAIDEKLKSIETELNNRQERLRQINIPDEPKVSEKDLIGERERLRSLSETKHLIEQKRKRKEDLSLERAKLLDEIKRLDIDENRYNTWNSEYVKISSELRAIKETLKRDDKSIDDSKQRLNYLKTKVNEYNSKRERLEILRKIVQELIEIHMRMEDLQNRRRRNLINKINMYFSMYWNSLYYSGVYSDPKIEVEDSGYVLVIRSGNNQVTADRLSGGEKTMYALALRMAILSLVTKNLRVMILDEPTHNLDESAIDSLIDNINKLYLEHIDQFIIITHDEKIKTNISWNMVISLNRDMSRDTSINYTKVDTE